MTITAGSGEASRTTPNGGGVRRCRITIQKNSLRMARLMEEVLLLGQADAGKLEVLSSTVRRKG